MDDHGPSPSREDRGGRLVHSRGAHSAEEPGVAQGGSKAQFVSFPLGDGEVPKNHRQLGIFLLGSFLLGYVNLSKKNINMIYDIYIYI
jgi:hypothetical protein